MSLINQMLTDLDQRQTAQATGSDAHNIPYSAHNFNGTAKSSGKNTRATILKLGALLFIVGLVFITGYYSYLIYTHRTVATAKPAPTPHETTLALTQPEKTIPVQQKQQHVKVSQAVLPVITAANNSVKAVLPIQSRRVAVAVQPPAPDLNINTDDVEPIIKHQSQQSESESDTGAEESFNTDPQSVQKQRLQLNPMQQAEVAYQQGYALLQHNKIYSAEAKLLLALEHNVKHIKARELLVGLYLKTGRKVEAQSSLAAGLLHLPDYTNFTKLYARTLLDNNEVDKAVHVLLQHKPAISADPNYYALLAASYQRQKNHNAAANTYVELLKLKPREGIWWIGMAISLEALHKNKDALHAYEQARQTGTLNTRISNYSSQRLQQLHLSTQTTAQ